MPKKWSCTTFYMEVCEVGDSIVIIFFYNRLVVLTEKGRKI